MIGFGSTNDVTTLLKEGTCYAPYILYTYAQIYGRAEVDPSQLLRQGWAASLEADANRLCVDEFQRYYPSSAQALYLPEFQQALYGGGLARAYPRLYARLEENRSGLDGHRLPALIVQGVADTVITTASQTRFVERLRAAGSSVEYLLLPGIRHRQTRAAGFRASIEWMERQRHGEKPPAALYE